MPTRSHGVGGRVIEPTPPPAVSAELDMLLGHDQANSIREQPQPGSFGVSDLGGIQGQGAE